MFAFFGHADHTFRNAGAIKQEVFLARNHPHGAHDFDKHVSGWVQT